MTINEFREVKTKRLEVLMYKAIEALSMEANKEIVRACFEAAIGTLQQPESGG